ncbi:hypothetical protein KCU62_g188, partial [Aureobasidium sp. EXF-3399]
MHGSLRTVARLIPTKPWLLVEVSNRTWQLAITITTIPIGRNGHEDLTDYSDGLRDSNMSQDDMGRNG